MSNLKWVTIEVLCDKYHQDNWLSVFQHPFNGLAFKEIKEQIEVWLDLYPEYDDIRIQECSKYNYGKYDSHYTYWYELQGLTGNPIRKVLYGK